MTAAAHAIYAPSSAHRWAAEGGCTASALAISRLPEQEEGEEAAEGTAAHEELERVLRGEPLDPDHDAAYAVALAVNYVRQLPPGQLWVEQRVRLTDDIWGRCDVCHWDPIGHVATIIDLKNGFVDVPAEENEQLQIYAAGSILTHNLPAKWARLVIVQPNSIMPGPRVKQWVTSTDSLYAFAQRVAAIPSGPLTFRAGEGCKYCPVFGKCPASADVLAKIAAAFCLSPDEVRPEQVALFKAMEKPIKDWFASLEKTWTKRALSGAAPPGMKLVQTTTRRAWIDEAAARVAVIAKAGVDVLELPTPAQAEKFGVDVSTLAASPPGGPALAFESDKRPDFTRKSAAEMFAGVVGATQG